MNWTLAKYIGIQETRKSRPAGTNDKNKKLYYFCCCIMPMPVPLLYSAKNIVHINILYFYINTWVYIALECIDKIILYQVNIFNFFFLSSYQKESFDKAHLQNEDQTIWNNLFFPANYFLIVYNFMIVCKSKRV